MSSQATTVNVFPPPPEVPSRGPGLIAIGHFAPGAEDGQTIRVSGAEVERQLIKALMKLSPVLREIFGEGFDVESGLEVFDRRVIGRRFDRLGAAPLLETCERWLRRASTTDGDVAALFAVVKTSASLGLPALRIPGSEESSARPTLPDARCPKRTGRREAAPGLVPTQSVGTVPARVKEAREAVATGLTVCEEQVRNAFPKLRIGADHVFVAQVAVLTAVMERSAAPTRVEALKSTTSLLTQVNDHLAARTTEAAEAIAPAAEAIASVYSMLENMGDARGGELTLVHYNDVELALSKADKRLIQVARRQKPSVDLLIANRLGSLESIDGLTSQFGTNPVAHGMLYASVDAQTIEAAKEIAAANPIRSGVADGHVTVYIGSGLHLASGVRIGLAPSVLGTRRRLDGAVDRPTFQRGYLNSVAGLAGAGLRSITGLREITSAGWEPEDAAALEPAGLNTLGTDNGVLYAMSAFTRSALSPYKFSDQVRFGDYVVGTGRYYFAREGRWLHGDEYTRDYLLEQFVKSVIERLAEHQGTKFTLLVEQGADPSELVVRINAAQSPYITRIRIIDSRTVEVSIARNPDITV